MADSTTTSPLTATKSSEKTCKKIVQALEKNGYKEAETKNDGTIVFREVNGKSLNVLLSKFSDNFFLTLCTDSRDGIFGYPNFLVHEDAKFQRKNWTAHLRIVLRNLF